MAEKITKYYLLSGKNPYQVATAYGNYDKTDDELIVDLEGKNELPFQLDLKKSTKGKTRLILSDDLSGLHHIWDDHQLNNFSWPLLSLKAKEIIESQLTGFEMIDWIRVRVNGNNEQRLYYIPRFNKSLDVLDIEETMFVEGTDFVIYPVFSLDKIKNYNVFIKPFSEGFQKLPSGIFVHENVKKLLQKADLSGFKFERVNAL